jgi:kynurenine formamidase
MARHLAAALALACALPACAAPGPDAPPPAPPGEPGFPGAWTLVDLTHVLDGGIPYWPGAKYFPFESWDLARYEEVRAFSRAYRVPEHYGTHVDAPVHFAPGQASVEAVPLDRFAGPAVVFDLRARAASDPDAGLTAADVDAWEAVHGRVPEGAVAVLRTGWEARWGAPEAYRNWGPDGRLRFPSYALDGARRLLVDRGCRGLCVDALSVDRGADEEFPVHRLGSGMGRWFAENVANLERLPPAGAWIFAAPVPIRGASGAQARVFALVPPR